MKKLMIAFAVVAMAACSQASMVYWSFADTAANNATKNPPWTYFDTAANLTGYKAFLILADDWSSEDVAGSLAKAQNAGGTAFSTSKWDTEKGQAQFQTGAQQATGLSLETDPSTKMKDYQFVVAVSDGDKYFVTDEITGTAVDDATVLGYKTVKVQLSNATAITPSALKPVGGDVPEPTSGLLLLLGVAGLALKRKVA